MYFEVLILVLQEDYVDKQHVHYLSVNQEDDLFFCLHLLLIINNLRSPVYCTCTKCTSVR